VRGKWKGSKMDAADLREKALTCRRLAVTLSCNNSARQALLDEAEAFEHQATELEIREHKRATREVAAFSLERTRQSAARRRGDRAG
jgi:hypothetical protein